MHCKKNYILFILIPFLFSCSATTNRFYKKSEKRDNPQDFVERRDPKDNRQLISIGSNNKNSIILENNYINNSPKSATSIVNNEQSKKSGFSKEVLNISTRRNGT